MLVRIVLFLVPIAGITAKELENFNKCQELFHPTTTSCCIGRPTRNPHKMEDLKECFDMPAKPHSCDKQLCIAKKQGYANPDGTLNKKALSEITEKYLKDNIELLELIKDNCIHGNIDVYGPNEQCDFIKMENCVALQFISQCKVFSDKAECSGLKDLAVECVEIFS